MADRSESDALALPSTEDSYVLVVETFHSKNRARKDPRKLPGFKDLSTNLRVITVCFFPIYFCLLRSYGAKASRPNDMKGFPDFQTFTVRTLQYFGIDDSVKFI